MPAPLETHQIGNRSSLRVLLSEEGRKECRGHKAWRSIYTCSMHKGKKAANYRPRCEYGEKLRSDAFVVQNLGGTLRCHP